MEIKQQLKLSQQLVMTPQLQQAIRLLQLSRLELIDEIRKELDANPVLADEEVDPRARANPELLMRPGFRLRSSTSPIWASGPRTSKFKRSIGSSFSRTAHCSSRS